MALKLSVRKIECDCMCGSFFIADLSELESKKNLFFRKAQFVLKQSCDRED